MRLVIQRVSSASVTVAGKTVGEIGGGLFVLIGAGLGDTEKDADRLAEKLVKLRVMGDAENKMNKSVAEVGGSFLLVSQFTLYADTRKGNRPSFVKAAPPQQAHELYNYFVQKVTDLGAKVQTGTFGAYMDIHLTADGPVTILLDSHD